MWSFLIHKKHFAHTRIHTFNTNAYYYFYYYFQWRPKKQYNPERSYCTILNININITITTIILLGQTMIRRFLPTSERHIITIVSIMKSQKGENNKMKNNWGEDINDYSGCPHTLMLQRYIGTPCGTPHSVPSRTTHVALGLSALLQCTRAHLPS